MSLFAITSPFYNQRDTPKLVFRKEKLWTFWIASSPCRSDIFIRGINVAIMITYTFLHWIVLEFVRLCSNNKYWYVRYIWLFRKGFLFCDYSLTLSSGFQTTVVFSIHFIGKQKLITRPFLSSVFLRFNRSLLSEKAVKGLPPTSFEPLNNKINILFHWNNYYLFAENHLCLYWNINFDSNYLEPSVKSASLPKKFVTLLTTFSKASLLSLCNNHLIFDDKW